MDPHIPPDIGEHVGYIDGNMYHLLPQQYGGLIQAINLPQKVRVLIII